MREFIEEVKRRNVFKVAVVYLFAAWLTMQVVDVMFDALLLPDWLGRAVAALLVLGFPFALIFAWAFELTPEGIKREKDVDRSESITQETGQKLNRTAIIVLGALVAFLLFDKFCLTGRVIVEPPMEDPAAAEAVVEEKPSIAVLPFVNMSDDESNEYFSDGLSEELLNLLAKIPDLHVAGRTSSFKFKGYNEDLRIVGEQLNVGHILEGSVRKSGDRLRITAQLINTENGFHLWSENFDRELTDIFAVQDEIASAVVNELKITLLGATMPHAGGTTSVEAYNAVLKGNYYLDRTSDENIKLARQAYNEALEYDPRYSEAYLGLATVEQFESGGWASNEDHSGEGDFIQRFERIREYADKAMALDGNNADAYVAQAIVSSTADWDMVQAIRLLETAVDIEPNNIAATGWLSIVYLFDSDIDAAESTALHSLNVDPLNIGNLRAIGDIYALSGRHEQALSYYEQAISLAPDAGRLHGRVGRLYLYRDDFDTAKTYIDKEPVNWVREQLNVILLRHTEGDEAWRAALDSYIETNGLDNSYQYAEIFAEAGDLDETFNWLETVARIKDPGAPWALNVPWFDEARKDPRWAAFEARFKL